MGAAPVPQSGSQPQGATPPGGSTGTTPSGQPAGSTGGPPAGANANPPPTGAGSDAAFNEFFSQLGSMTDQLDAGQQQMLRQANISQNLTTLARANIGGAQHDSGRAQDEGGVATREQSQQHTQEGRASVDRSSSDRFISRHQDAGRHSSDQAAGERATGRATTREQGAAQRQARQQVMYKQAKTATPENPDPVRSFGESADSERNLQRNQPQISQKLPNANASQTRQVTRVLLMRQRLLQLKQEAGRQQPPDTALQEEIDSQIEKLMGELPEDLEVPQELMDAELELDDPFEDSEIDTEEAGEEGGLEDLDASQQVHAEEEAGGEGEGGESQDSAGGEPQAGALSSQAAQMAPRDYGNERELARQSQISTGGSEQADTEMGMVADAHLLASVVGGGRTNALFAQGNRVRAVRSGGSGREGPAPQDDHHIEMSDSTIGGTMPVYNLAAATPGEGSDAPGGSAALNHYQLLAQYDAQMRQNPDAEFFTIQGRRIYVEDVQGAEAEQVATLCRMSTVGENLRTGREIGLIRRRAQYLDPGVVAQTGTYSASAFA